MIRFLIVATVLSLAITPTAYAKTAAPPVMPQVKRAYVGDFPIATTVTVPAGYETIYISGQVPAVSHPDAEAGSLAAYGTTEEQTTSVIGKIRTALQAQGADLGDIVSMRVYLVGDPALGGKMDFGGMMKAYVRFFGTTDQPNKPTRAALQIAGLAGPGFLVEIECVAVHKPK